MAETKIFLTRFLQDHRLNIGEALSSCLHLYKISENKPSTPHASRVLASDIVLARHNTKRPIALMAATLSGVTNR